MIPHGFEPRHFDSESPAPIVIGHRYAGYLLALNLASSVPLAHPLALGRFVDIAFSVNARPDAITQQVAVLAAR